MAFKLNKPDEYESIEITITKDKYPILFKNKVEELLEQGAFSTQTDAENFVEGMVIELELYYEKNNGFFAVESEAIGNGCEIASPYTMDVGEPFDE